MPLDLLTDSWRLTRHVRAAARPAYDFATGANPLSWASFAAKAIGVHVGLEGLSLPGVRIAGGNAIAARRTPNVRPLTSAQLLETVLTNNPLDTLQGPFSTLGALPTPPLRARETTPVVNTIATVGSIFAGIGAVRGGVSATRLLAAEALGSTSFLDSLALESLPAARVPTRLVGGPLGPAFTTLREGALESVPTQLARATLRAPYTAQQQTARAAALPGALEELREARALRFLRQTQDFSIPVLEEAGQAAATRSVPLSALPRTAGEAVGSAAPRTIGELFGPALDRAVARPLLARFDQIAAQAAARSLSGLVAEATFAPTFRAGALALRAASRLATPLLVHEVLSGGGQQTSMGADILNNPEHRRTIRLTFQDTVANAILNDELDAQAGPAIPRVGPPVNPQTGGHRSILYGGSRTDISLETFLIARAVAQQRLTEIRNDESLGGVPTAVVAGLRDLPRAAPGLVGSLATAAADGFNAVTRSLAAAATLPAAGFLQYDRDRIARETTVTPPPSWYERSLRARILERVRRDLQSEEQLRELWGLFEGD